ncbi:MAG: CBS domain-containing protein [Rhodospirillaceae bacterium]|nr:CBS domain-containing protein [Rhodospirillaceae bacterium]
MAAQTEIFRKRVRDVMGTPPVACGPETTLAEVVALIARSGQSSVVVVDADRRSVGILTERDITRRVTFQHGREMAVAAVMTRPVAVAKADDHLYRAIARMRRQQRRHMPVVDDRDRLVGTLDLTETLAATASRTMGQIERLTQDDDVAGLRQVKAAQADIAEALLGDNLPAPDIQALLTDINRDIHRRLAETVT